MAGLERIAAQGPSPEFAAMMAEECGASSMHSTTTRCDRLRSRRMEGYNNDEIALPARLCAADRGPPARPDQKTWLATEEIAE